MRKPFPVFLDCEDFAAAGVLTNPCCSSCHSEWWDGYSEPIDEHPPAKSGQPAIWDERIVAHLCCGKLPSNRELTRTEWAKALLAYRKRAKKQ